MGETQLFHAEPGLPLCYSPNGTRSELDDAVIMTVDPELLLRYAWERQQHKLDDLKTEAARLKAEEGLMVEGILLLNKSRYADDPAPLPREDGSCCICRALPECPAGTLTAGAHFRQRVKAHLSDCFRHAPWWIMWISHVTLGIILLQLVGLGITYVFGRRPTQRTSDPPGVISMNSRRRARGAGPDLDPDPILRREPSQLSETKPRVVTRRLEPLTSPPAPEVEAAAGPGPLANDTPHPDPGIWRMTIAAIGLLVFLVPFQ
jgi:hypothetical protein